MRITAAVLLALGIVAFNSGLVLIGSPLSANHLAWQARAALGGASSAAVASMPTDLKAPALNQTIQEQAISQVVVHATNTGYAPEAQPFPAETPFELVLVTENTLSCTRAFMVRSLGIEAMLPVDGRVSFDIPAQPAGSRLFYTCSMGMYGGIINFDS